MQEKCGHLTCLRHDNMCVYSDLPAAEGTECAPGKVMLYLKYDFNLITETNKSTLFLTLRLTLFMTKHTILVPGFRSILHCTD